MTGLFASVVDVVAANRTGWRRARNLRAACARLPTRPALPRPGWLAIAALAAALAGAAVLVLHARALVNAAPAPTPAAALSGVLAGATLVVPREAAIELVRHGGADVLMLAGAQAGPVLRIDLCTQLADPARTRLLPLRVGWRFEEVARLAGPLRGVVLAPGGATMPRIEIGGNASAGTALSVRWSGDARWVGDAGGGGADRAALARQGWLVWGGRDALRLTRRASAACPQAGELVLQAYRAVETAPAGASVVAFAPDRAPVTAWLPAGTHRIPPPAARPGEDEALFGALLAHGLVRLNAAGLAELAPPDLAQWEAAGQGVRAPLPGAWQPAARAPESARLLARLYHRADGAYVREQVRIFNSERRLLAWRLPMDQQGIGARLEIDGIPVQPAEGIAPAAARLFARLPAGWAPWMGAPSWPGTGRIGEIVLSLPRAADAGMRPQVLLAGRLVSVAGATLAAREAACTGRACTDPGAVERLTLAPLPGTREIHLRALPLDTTGLAAAEAPHRHLVADDAGLRWQPLGTGAGTAAGSLAPVLLAARDGELLWSDGAPTPLAARSGLSTLLGLHPGHAASIAGMLARLPSPSGAVHRARLSIDTRLQGLANAVLDCVALRRGRWNGTGCEGGATPAVQRQAGMLILDTESGDVLAAASSGSSPDVAAWSELRDFDRANPAASPLRVPALQHDGGAHRSPGSTFKLVTALGLELAAQRDAGIDALLGGRRLAEIDRRAQAAGFGFRTGSAAYPANTARAHVTNFREQPAARRAEGGVLGLEQALSYSLNTWFAWTAEMSDATLSGRPEGGVPGVQALAEDTLGRLRPVAGMAQRVGFGPALRLDGGLLPAGYRWSEWDVLRPPPARIDPIHTRHEVRQMAIGLRMQAAPLHMALAAGAVGQGRAILPRLLLELDGRPAHDGAGAPLGVRLDRVRSGMKGVVDHGTAAAAFRGAQFDRIRAGLFAKTGTAPSGARDASGRALSTVWFAGWLEPGALPGPRRRLAFAVFASHSDATGGEHVAPAIAALLLSVQENSKAKY